MIRAFIALPMPDEARHALTGLQAGLRIGRAVPPENFHMTLAFLGEHPRPVLEDLHLALEGISAPKAEIAFDGVGLFGGGKPTSLHAHVAPTDALRHLRRKVETAIRDAGIDRAREKFVPHVTLARFGRLSDEERIELQDGIARRLDFSAGPFVAGEFCLYRSSLRSGEPPIYEDLATYRLG